MITQDGTMIRTNKEAPMPRDKIKPPAETKAQLMQEVWSLLQTRWPNHPEKAADFLLNFFTSADLVGIRDELKK